MFSLVGVNILDCPRPLKHLGQVRKKLEMSSSIAGYLMSCEVIIFAVRLRAIVVAKIFTMVAVNLRSDILK